MISEAPHFATTPAPPNAEALVCVVDDDESVRRVLKRLLRSARLAVETFASAADYLEREEYPGPVCLVLDPQDGLNLQTTLEGHGEQIVFLTENGDVPMCARAMKAGAVDFLLKPVNDEILLSSVTRALAVAREVRRTNAERTVARAALKALTPREFQVMEQVLAGLLNKQIASRLGIAEKTVKIHRGRLMRKTRSRSVPDLMRLSLKAEAFNLTGNEQLVSP
jgi:two-component system response regulator FixJ